MTRLQALAQPTIWLSTARSIARGRAARDYVVYDDAGSPLLVAQTSAWEREIVVQTAAEPRQTLLVLRRRLLFPLTGRVDVRDERGARIGIVTRSGRYYAGAERTGGSFRDARTFGSRAREGVLVGVLDALLAADGTMSGTSAPHGFVWRAGPEVLGTLSRARLPFTQEPVAAEPGGATSRVKTLTKRLRALAAPAGPQGWKLERMAQEPPTDPRLIIAAALFAIELAHW